MKDGWLVRREEVREEVRREEAATTSASASASGKRVIIVLRNATWVGKGVEAIVRPVSMRSWAFVIETVGLCFFFCFFFGGGIVGTAAEEVEAFLRFLLLSSSASSISSAKIVWFEEEDSKGEESSLAEEEVPTKSKSYSSSRLSPIAVWITRGEESLKNKEKYNKEKYPKI